MEVTLDPPTPEAWAELRRAGHRMLDDMLDHLATVRDRRPWTPMPAEARDRLAGEPPLDPAPLDEVYRDFRRDILPYPTGNTHPRFWGWVMGSGTPVGMLAEVLAAGMNAHVAGYDQSATAVERVVVGWLADLLGLGSMRSGLLVSGATEANLIGLTVARSVKAGFDVRGEGLQGDRPRLRVYASSETHSWARRACEQLGLGATALRSVPVDGAFRMDVRALREAVATDRAAGERPICVIGNAGTVNTGATDDLVALAAVAREEGLWFHIDGAFGALAMLSEGLRPQLAGMEEADSVAFDLHKWGYVQYEVGCVLVRDEVAHRAAFAMSPVYLQPAKGGIAPESLYFADRGIQLSRGFRALKVWMTLRTQGARAWGRAIQQNVDQARLLAELVAAEPELELLAPVPLNVVCFRYRGARATGGGEPELAALNQAVLVELQERGIAVPSGTVLQDSHGARFGIRVANTNHRSRRADFRALVAAVVDLGRELAAARRASAG